MLLSLSDTYNIITENTNLQLTKTDLDTITAGKQFTTRPQGILIQDSYNNPFYKIRPTPRIDTHKSEILELYRRFREIHAKSKSVYLPWHYVIEMVGRSYMVYNTRPTHIKFPMSTQTYLSNLYETDDSLTSASEIFFTERPFDVSEAIHICLIGDSNSDIYTKQLYKMLTEICIQPQRRYHKLKGLFTSIYAVNLAYKFDPSIILNYLH